MTWPHPLTHWTTHPPNYPCTNPWVGVSLWMLNLQTELNHLNKVQIYSIFSHLTWPHPFTTHPPTHPAMGGGVSTNHKSSNRIESSRLGQDLFNFKSFDLTPPIYHPSTHTPSHGWGCLPPNHKSSNRIELSQIGQDLFNFKSFDLTPPIDPPIQPWVGVPLQIINLQTELNYLE